MFKAVLFGPLRPRVVRWRVGVSLVNSNQGSHQSTISKTEVEYRVQLEQSTKADHSFFSGLCEPELCQLTWCTTEEVPQPVCFITNASVFEMTSEDPP